MSAPDPSKETSPSFNPGHPTTYGAGPMMPDVNAAHGSSPYNSGHVVTTQPMVIVAPARAYEKDYLGYSIFTMLCCCLPIGIGALIYSIKTRDANNSGDTFRAHQNSHTALKLNNVALGLGIFITLGWVGYVIYSTITYNPNNKQSTG